MYVMHVVMQSISPQYLLSC